MRDKYPNVIMIIKSVDTGKYIELSREKYEKYCYPDKENFKEYVRKYFNEQTRTT